MDRVAIFAGPLNFKRELLIRWPIRIHDPLKTAGSSPAGVSENRIEGWPAYRGLAGLFW